ncbi:hypothetical protein IMZ29_00880 [Achromobacter sp. GG226]|uniref:hypothetical protein n=1 Tax=Verticiella alkaliphila TaxID=2779529 RepID=UPI001C0C4C72|nr:hypothetical protein [Verticiella sp. GG226]MBU4609157.1 hypothetical protein [Verticiella sp. GG226]
MTIDRESLRPAFERACPVPRDVYWHQGVSRYCTDQALIECVQQQSRWEGFCAAFESLGEPVGKVGIREPVEVPGRPSATRIKTRSVNVYRIPEVKA